MNQLTINPEFKNLIPSLSEEDMMNLEKDIIEYGCLDPISIWNDMIIDGHNRYNICIKNNIEFKTRSLQFNTEDDVKIWMIKYQIHRRNLNVNDKNRLFYELMEIERKKNVARPGRDLVKDLNISRGTEYRATQIIENGTDELKNDVKQGKTTINAAYNKLPGRAVKEYTSNPSTADLFDDVDLKPSWSESIKQNVKNFSNSEEGLNADIPKRIYNKTEWTLEPTLLKWDIINQIMDDQSSKIGGHSSVVSLINYLLAKELKNYEKGITL